MGVIVEEGVRTPGVWGGGGVGFLPGLPGFLNIVPRTSFLLGVMEGRRGGTREIPVLYTGYKHGHYDSYTEFIRLGLAKVFAIIVIISLCRSVVLFT